MSSAVSISPGGTPSTIHPTEHPWDSPYVVTRKSVPNVDISDTNFGQIPIYASKYTHLRHICASEPHIYAQRPLYVSLLSLSCGHRIYLFTLRGTRKYRKHRKHCKYPKHQMQHRIYSAKPLIYPIYALIYPLYAPIFTVYPTFFLPFIAASQTPVPL